MGRILPAFHRAHEEPMIRLRPSRPDDLAFVTTLERHPDNRAFIGQWSDEQHLAAMDAPGRSHLIVEEEGAAVGYLIAYDCAAAGCGVYVKRLLVKNKGRGVGRAALSLFIDEAFARPEVALAWLIVFEFNVRAQAVYRALGFERFDPPPSEAARFDRIAEPPPEGALRMRLHRPPGIAG
jgi:diamine N-acetyltransferase